MNFLSPASSFAPAPEDDSAADVDGLEHHNGENWTDEQILTLAKLIRVEGLSNAEAGKRMGRTEPSIIMAVSRFSIRDPKARLRGCIPCYGRQFFGTDISNRICGRCKARGLDCA